VARRPLREALLEPVDEGVAHRVCWRGWWTVRRGVVEGFLRVAGVPFGRSVGVGFLLLGCEVAIGHGSNSFIVVGVAVY